MHGATSQWDAAKRLLDDALQLETAAREPFVRERCRHEPALLEEVLSLLSWADGSDTFLEHPLINLAQFTPDTTAGDPLIGRTIGAWRVVSIIARGGMGVVYRAERADGAFKRPAALKVVGAGADATAILARFQREREMLAALDHPNIARLFDGGTMPDGAPYFVMEYVDGMPVDRYCDDQRLSIDERLRLFQTICGAVQYAHQSLVVHRDLKPDNILVARDGTPKLLDFGIARLASQGPADDRASTAATWLLTPDYASPEQVNGGAITTATDVYSLTVLLHVLLTGGPPSRFTAASHAALRAEVAGAVITPPSQRIESAGPAAEPIAAARGTSLPALMRRLKGDLDAIIMRGLAREPRDRYANAQQLSDDVGRHLGHQPVSARRADLPYVTGRFIRRHTLGLAVAAGMALVLIGGVAAVLWQASIAAAAQAKAERRFEDVRRLAHVFMFDVHDELVNVPGTTGARALMVRTASQYLGELEREVSGDLGLQRELASAFVKVGDSQGHPASANIGDTAGARASYERAIDLSTAILRARPDDVETQRTRALAHRRLADVLAWAGDRTSALDHVEVSRAEFTIVAERRDATVDDRLQGAVARIKLGDLLGNPNFPNLGRVGEANVEYAAALDALRTLRRDNATNTPVLRYLGLTLERIGTMAETAGAWQDAAAAYQESFEIRRTLAAGLPFHTEMQRDLAIAFEKLANVQLSLHNVRFAVDSYRGALAQFEQLAAADPSNAMAARTVAISRENLARALESAGDREAAIDMLTRALDTHRQLASRDAGNAQARCDSVRLDERLGDLLTQSGRFGTTSQSCTLWRDGLALFRELSSTGIQCAAAIDVQRITSRLAQCP